MEGGGGGVEEVGLDVGAVGKGGKEEGGERWGGGYGCGDGLGWEWDRWAWRPDRWDMMDEYLF